jgi:hypothetical protein
LSSASISSFSDSIEHKIISYDREITSEYYLANSPNTPFENKSIETVGYRLKSSTRCFGVSHNYLSDEMPVSYIALILNLILIILAHLSLNRFFRNKNIRLRGNKVEN